MLKSFKLKLEFCIGREIMCEFKCCCKCKRYRQCKLKAEKLHITSIPNTWARCSVILKEFVLIIFFAVVILFIVFIFEMFGVSI